MKTITPAPVRRSLFVRTAPDRAFKVFTARMGAWWPAAHHIGQVPFKDVIVEPREGGRWYEIMEDGAECDWGRVLVWSPPGRLVLGWQLNAQFAFDPDFMTEVEVRFTAEGEGTRVEFEHRNLERYGEMADQVSESIGSEGGWPFILQSFADLAGAEA